MVFHFPTISAVFHLCLCLSLHKFEVHTLFQPPITHFSLRTNTHVCINPATVLLLMPYCLQQRTRSQNRRITTSSRLVTPCNSLLFLFLKNIKIKTSTIPPTILLPLGVNPIAVNKYIISEGGCRSNSQNVLYTKHMPVSEKCQHNCDGCFLILAGAMQNNKEIKFYENSQSLVSKLTSSEVTIFITQQIFFT